jgi:protein TonB
MVSPARKMTAPLPAAPVLESGPNRVRLAAAGIAVLLHGGMVALLLLVPASPPILAAPETVPMVIAMAEPVVEETPAPVAEPEQAEPEAPSPEPTPVAEPPPPEPAPPEPMPPEPEPLPPDPVVPEEPPPAPVEPEPPPPEPVPEEAPAPEPALEPLPEPPPPQPPPPPVPTPRPRAPRAVPPRPATAAPAAAPAAPAPVAARAAAPPPSYLRAVAAALERQKRYPESARTRRASGVALLRFTVLRNGRVAGWRIDRSAGDSDLDEAVAAMIQRVSLPAMPEDMPGDSLVITVPVRFQLR